jgi:hypothetical protein
VKKLISFFVVFVVFAAVFMAPVAYADPIDSIFGKNGVMSVPIKLAQEVGTRGVKLFNALLGGDYYRDYGDTGYRHGGYAYQYDYGTYGEGNNGYGYNHQGLDGNAFSGI